MTPEVKCIILTQALTHELGHTIFARLLYGRNQYIKLPDGKIMDGAAVIDEFVRLTQSRSPMSHYSSGYRESGTGRYPVSDNQNPMAFKVAVDEELQENVTAYLLGFVFCDDEQRRLAPFCDRPDVEAFVRALLHAEKARSS